MINPWPRAHLTVPVLQQVFRFVDTDLKASGKSLRVHENELNQVLRETVPGLVQGSGDGIIQSTLSSSGTDERLLGVGHHRLLIQPDAFHVGVLFQPTLAFLERVADVCHDVGDGSWDAPL